MISHASVWKTAVCVALLGNLASCATAPTPKDYTAFYGHSPKSILVVPVVNHSNEAEAADLFLTTLAIPLAERGYYVFPTNVSKKLIEAEGLSDPGLVHGSPTPLMAGLFGADSVLYVEILDWKSGYQVISSTIEVRFIYTLKSGTDGSVLWQDEQNVVWSRNSSSGNIFADLLVSAITAAVDNARSDYTPVAMQANIAALTIDGQGLPYGPHSANVNNNKKQFPATGGGNLSNAQSIAISAGQLAPAK